MSSQMPTELLRAPPGALIAAPKGVAVEGRAPSGMKAHFSELPPSPRWRAPRGGALLTAQEDDLESRLRSDQVLGMLQEVRLCKEGRA